MGASASGPGSRASTEPVPVSAASGFDPSRWSVGDILRAAGDIWRVGSSPENHPDWILVERLFARDDAVMNVPSGHAYPATHEIWRRFERLMPGAERYAIAMEARQGTDPQGLDGEAATARAEGIAKEQSQ